MKTGQAINFDGQQLQAGRGGDPYGVFPASWGNQTGNIWAGAEPDGANTALALWNGTTRVRVRIDGLTCNGDILAGRTVQATQDLRTASSSISSDFAGAVQFGAGGGTFLAYNNATGKFEFYVGTVKVAQLPP